MTYCSNCQTINEQTAAFCINCGQEIRSSAPEMVPTANGMEPKRFVTTLRPPDIKSLASRLLARLANAKDRGSALVKSNRRIFVPSTVFAALVLAYFGAQMAVTQLNGPESTLNRYVVALQSGDFKALDDQSLFPGASNNTPKRIKNSWNADFSSAISFSDVERDGLAASAKITANGDTSILKLKLKAQEAWVWGFRVPEWSILEKAPRAQLIIPKHLDPQQVLNFDASQNFETSGVSVGSLKGDKSLMVFNVLPGHYSMQISAKGFVKQQTSEFDAFVIDSKVNFVAGQQDVKVKNSILAAAKRSVTSKAKSCANSSCGAMGRYQEEDFSLWSTYPYSTYTSKRFSVKYSARSCWQSGSVQLISTNKARINFECSVKASAKLYVTYTYYNGWYSDYYYYWNFKDSKEYSIYPSVEIQTDDSMKSVRITSTKLN